MLGLTGLNLGVFLMWNVYDDDEDGDKKQRNNNAESPRRVFSEQFMMNQYTTNTTNLTEGRLWTPLTASVSHQSLGHLAGNMFAFWLFGFPTYRVMGSKAFWGLYGAGGVACSMAHVVHNVVTGRTQPPLSEKERHQIEQLMQSQQQQQGGGGWFNNPHPHEDFETSSYDTSKKLMERLRRADMPSLGASGSVMAISAVSAALFPMDHVRPNPRLFFYIPLPLAVGIYVASDLVGVTDMLSESEDPMASGSNVDHAGHLGGLVMGIYYVTTCWYGKKGSFKFLQKLVKGGDLPIVYRFKQRFVWPAATNKSTGAMPFPKSRKRGRFRL
jgi:membrane associated rhomboid family serine protease